jgi:hypothetical protein
VLGEGVTVTAVTLALAVGATTTNKAAAMARIVSTPSILPFVFIYIHSPFFASLG